MAVKRILTKRVRTTGEPNPTRVRVNPWPRQTQVSRPRMSVRTLRKNNPADALGLAGVESIVRDSATGLTIPAGTGARTTAPVRSVKIKRANLTPRTARGTKVVKTPSPTNRGGVRNLFGKRGI